MQIDDYESNINERSNSVVKHKHKTFEHAWIAAGCPRHFQWSPQTGRMWDLRARKEHLEFIALSPGLQKRIIEQRKMEFENRQKRAHLKNEG